MVSIFFTFSEKIKLKVCLLRRCFIATRHNLLDFQIYMFLFLLGFSCKKLRKQTCFSQTLPFIIESDTFCRDTNDRKEKHNVVISKCNRNRNRQTKILFRFLHDARSNISIIRRYMEKTQVKYFEKPFFFWSKYKNKRI